MPTKPIYTYIPYTYRITFLPTNQHYYGVRYAKGCNPKDLWETYFTSSKIIDKLIKEYGKDAFITEIRKTFNNADSARLWETKVLKRLKVTQTEKWLNQTDNISPRSGKGYIVSDETRQKQSDSHKGKKITQQHKDNIGLANKGKIVSNKTRERISKSKMNWKPTTKTRKLWSKLRKGKKLFGENSNARPISISGFTFTSRKEAYNYFGVSKGTFTKYLKQDCIYSPIYICPYCNLLSGSRGNMTKWHFRKCKKYDSQLVLP